MSEQYTVSVVIPCYNQGEYLKETLDSVAKSTYPNIEVIVIDDGSTDQESIKYFDSLKGYSIKGKQVTFIHQKNQGLSATRNNAIRQSSGEFILPLDADDMIDPTFIEKCVWVLTKYKDISIVYPSVQHFGTLDTIWYPIPYNFQSLLKDNFMIATSMFRKKVWEDTGGYDINLPAYEDWDFWIRAGAIGHTGYWLREALFFYRKKEVSMLVGANKNREKLIHTLRTKNKEIYESYQQKNKPREDIKQMFSPSVRQKLSLWKWRVFQTYVRIASKVPESIKSRGRAFIKPIIRSVFRYPETRYQEETQFQISAPYQERDATETYTYSPNKELRDILLHNAQEKKVLVNNALSILFIVPWLKVGGADKVNLDLVTAFAAKGHLVHIFTTLKSEHEWHERFHQVTPNITHIGNWFEDEKDALLDYVLDYIKNKKIDIIQISNSQLGYEITSIIKEHYPEIQIFDLLHMEEPYYPFDYFRYSVRFKGSFDHRIVITPYLKEAMIRKYGETPGRVTVIPNGIQVPKTYEDTDYDLKNNTQEFTVGFVGRMEEQKQPLDFIRAAHYMLSSSKQKLRFVMVGDGSLFVRTQQEAKDLEIQEHVEFLGARDDAIEIMKKQFHVLLAPSLREGLPIVGLEALSLGIPIVATEVPGWVNLIKNGQTGYLTAVNDYKNMARCCLQLLDDHEERNDISKKAYELVKNEYSIESTSLKYLDIYKGN